LLPIPESFPEALSEMTSSCEMISGLEYKENTLLEESYSLMREKNKNIL